MIKDILHHINLIPVKETDDDYLCECPFHVIGKQKSSLYVHKEKGIYHCWICESKGIIEKLVAKKLNVPMQEAVAMVKNKFDIYTADPEKLQQFIEDIPDYDGRQKRKVAEDEPMAESELLLYKGKHTYLTNRGINEETQREFEIGYDPFWKRVTIPIRNEDGELVSIVGRGIFDDIQPKYYFYNTFKKGNVLYNLHRVKESFPVSQSLILVEGTLDCMWMYQIGYNNVVASFGCNVTKTQAGLIAKNCRQLFCLYDGDTAGTDGRVRVDELLGNRIKVKHVLLPHKYKDPVGIMKKEMDVILAKAGLLI